MVALLVIAILTTTIVAIQVVDITGGSSDGDAEDVSELMARTGCLDMTMVPTAEDPPVSMFDAEADARNQVARGGALADVEVDDDEVFVPGDLVWAEYGEILPPNGRQDSSETAWVLVFKDDRHESGWDRFINRRIDSRFSVIYRAETGQIITACTGEV
jgi:hypothetical protein